MYPDSFKVFPRHCSKIFLGLCQAATKKSWTKIYFLDLDGSRKQNLGQSWLRLGDIIWEGISFFLLEKKIQDFQDIWDAWDVQIPRLLKNTVFDVWKNSLRLLLEILYPRFLILGVQESKLRNSSQLRGLRILDQAFEPEILGPGAMPGFPSQSWKYSKRNISRLYHVRDTLGLVRYDRLC